MGGFDGLGVGEASSRLDQAAACPDANRKRERVWTGRSLCASAGYAEQVRRIKTQLLPIGAPAGTDSRRQLDADASGTARLRTTLKLIVAIVKNEKDLYIQKVLFG